MRVLFAEACHVALQLQKSDGEAGGMVVRKVNDLQSCHTT